AMTDPDPRVAGKGMEELANQGIIVEEGLLQSQAEKLNPGFIKRMKTGRPYIRLKLAMSLDGRTAMASGESKWITGTLARQDVQAWRARSSVIMTGIGTVLADNPSLNVRASELPDYYEQPETLRQPLRAIIDTHLSISGEEKTLDLPGQIVMFTGTEDPDHEQMLEEKGVDVVYLPNRSGGTDLVRTCESLAVDYEANEVLLECGANLSGAMLREELVDELIIYMSPMLMGSEARGLCNLPWIENLNQSIHLDIQDIRAIGKDWRIIAKPYITESE
ncbi:MAG: bifunctional diaminohydroxyphosphoribosylaminopyrimidine deaminase/5-amino-6-(5-phosphoribosylamino)uracil reductase RibD, partial [Pseudomonadota bacterium]